jgi:metal-responsive CopG/Arc/MetJ family transcriptional regulator
MKSKNRRVIFQMPETLIQELTRLAEREFTSRGAIVRRLVSEAASKSASA